MEVNYGPFNNLQLRADVYGDRITHPNGLVQLIFTNSPGWEVGAGYLGEVRPTNSDSYRPQGFDVHAKVRYLFDSMFGVAVGGRAVRLEGEGELADRVDGQVYLVATHTISPQVRTSAGANWTRRKVGDAVDSGIRAYANTEVALSSRTILALDFQSEYDNFDLAPMYGATLRTRLRPLFGGPPMHVHLTVTNAEPSGIGALNATLIFLGIDLGDRVESL